MPISYLLLLCSDGERLLETGDALEINKTETVGKALDRAGGRTDNGRTNHISFVGRQTKGGRRRNWMCTGISMGMLEKTCETRFVENLLGGHAERNFR